LRTPARLARAGRPRRRHRSFEGGRRAGAEAAARIDAKMQERLADHGFSEMAHSARAPSI
jgi:hypothetical protein